MRWVKALSSLLVFCLLVAIAISLVVERKYRSLVPSHDLFGAVRVVCDDLFVSKESITINYRNNLGGLDDFDCGDLKVKDKKKNDVVASISFKTLDLLVYSRRFTAYYNHEDGSFVRSESSSNSITEL